MLDLKDRAYAGGSCLTAQQAETTSPSPIGSTEVKEEMPFPKQPAIIRLTGADLLYGLEEHLTQI